MADQSDGDDALPTGERAETGVTDEERRAVIERNTTVESGECECKVGVVMEKYDFAERESRLLQYWVGVRTPDEQWREVLGLADDPADVDDVSLRTLERYLNVTLLRHAFIEAAENPPLQTVAEIYDRYRDDKASAEALSWFEQAEAIDLGTVARDFVSYSTISRHFHNCCGIDAAAKQRTFSRERVAEQAHTYEDYFQSRLQRVLQTVANNADDTTHDQKEVVTRTEIYCRACGSGVPLYEFIRGRTCECERD